jgi:hypothetical protein
VAVVLTVAVALVLVLAVAVVLAVWLCGCGCEALCGWLCVDVWMSRDTGGPAVPGARPGQATDGTLRPWLLAMCGDVRLCGTSVLLDVYVFVCVCVCVCVCVSLALAVCGRPLYLISSKKKKLQHTHADRRLPCGLRPPVP